MNRDPLHQNSASDGDDISFQKSQRGVAPLLKTYQALLDVQDGISVMRGIRERMILLTQECNIAQEKDLDLSDELNRQQQRLEDVRRTLDGMKPFDKVHSHSEGATTLRACQASESTISNKIGDLELQRGGIKDKRERASVELENGQKLAEGQFTEVVEALTTAQRSLRDALGGMPRLPGKWCEEILSANGAAHFKAEPFDVDSALNELEKLFIRYSLVYHRLFWAARISTEDGFQSITLPSLKQQSQRMELPHWTLLPNDYISRANLDTILDACTEINIPQERTVEYFQNRYPVLIAWGAVAETGRSDQPKKVPAAALVYELKDTLIVLHCLAVHPRFRRNGIASEVISRLLLRHLDCNNCSDIRAFISNENVGGRRFLESLGFRKVSEQEQNGGASILLQDEYWYSVFFQKPSEEM